MTYRLKTAVLLVLAAVFLFSAAGLAAGEGESPYTEAAIAAVPKVSLEAPTAAIEKDGLLSIRVTIGEGAAATTAAVHTQGLQFLYANGGMSTEGGLLLLPEQSSAVYHYKVMAGPQEQVAFELTDVRVLLTADGEDEPAPAAAWSGVVSGKPPAPTAGPGTDQPLPSVRPQGPLVIAGTAGISVNGELRTNRTIDVVISTTEDGLEGRLETRGLEFVDVDNRLCGPGSVVLVGSTGASATYTFVVNADPGEEVSVDVTGVTVSINGQDVAGTSSSWINWVPTAAAPSATATRDPGTHQFTLSRGLRLTALPSGRTAIGGWNATRSGQSVQDFLQGVTVPAGCRVQVLNAEGAVLSGSARITSGCELRVLNAAGLVIDQAVVALGGDVRGVGVMDVAQLVLVAQYLGGTRVPTELQQFCADMNGSGRIDITDLVSMVQIMQA